MEVAEGRRPPAKFSKQEANMRIKILTKTTGWHEYEGPILHIAVDKVGQNLEVYNNGDLLALFCHEQVCEVHLEY